MTHLRDDSEVELSSRALSILEEAQREVKPTPAERERGLARLRAATSGALTNSAMTSGAPTADEAELGVGVSGIQGRKRTLRALTFGAAMSATFQLAAAHAVKVGVATVAVVAVGVWQLSGEQERPLADIPVVSPVEAPVAGPAKHEPTRVLSRDDSAETEPATEPERTTELAEATALPPPVVARKRPEKRQSPPAQDNGTRAGSGTAAPRASAEVKAEPPLAAEARTLSRVNTLLRKNQNGEALALLNGRRPVVLVREWQAARAIALCGQGSAQGRATAQRFLEAHGTSPLAARVRGACGVD